MNAREEYKKRQMQRQTVIFSTISGVLLVLLIVGTLGWTGILPLPSREFSQPPDGNPVPCPIDDAAPVPAGEISARVYNATNQSGLAADAASQLAAAGVVIADTGNWTGAASSEPVRILTNADGITAAYTLRAFFPEAIVQFDQNIANQVVDVVIDTAETERVATPTEEQFQQAMKAPADCHPLSDFTG